MFGGAFDPPHIGHQVVAQDVYEALNLDRLLVVPSARPPHRAAVLTSDDRLELTRSAFGGDPRFEVSDIELRRVGPSWTVDTLEEIRRDRAPDEMVLAIGEDQYRSFESWREPERILELATLAVMPRDGVAPEMDPRFPFVPVPVTRVDVSSTRVRERLTAGQTTRYLVPESIRGRLEEIWTGTKAGAPDGAGAAIPGLDGDAKDGC